VKQWLRWLFRRGQRSTLVLNMHPADQTVAMTTYRDWLVVLTRAGEVFMITADRWPTADTVPQAIVQRMRFEDAR
jgi:hypothetical protein